MEQPARGHGSNLFSKRYSADDMARLVDASRQETLVNMGGMGSMGGSHIVGGQSLDEIINQNSEEQQRRRNVHQQYANSRHSSGSDIRRSSMLDFRSPAHSDLDGYSFNQVPTRHSSTILHNGGGIAKRRMDSKNAAQRRNSSHGQHVALETQLQDFGIGLDSMTQSPMFQSGMDSDQMPLDLSDSFMEDVAMDTSYSDVLDPNLSNDANMFSNADFNAILSNIPASMPREEESGHSALTNSTEAIMDKMPQVGMSDDLQPDTVNSIPQQPSNGVSDGMMQGVATNGQSMQFDQQANSADFDPENNQGTNTFSTGPAMTTAVQSQPVVPRYLDAYSQSGFDMLGVLMRVAARPKPQINIGAVDMSCAFVVCDVSQHDIPIVYCSEMFERLTGYSKHEILGQNCRFLQAPDGKVQSGVKRKYVDDKSVLHLKNLITQRQEAQISLINYRKGGQPFMNLLTMIPITWDSDKIKYFVGFQVDLVEQPTSITNKNPDGSYSINYQRGLLPRYVINNTPETTRAKELDAHTIERDEVSTVLSTIGTGETEYSKRIWDKVVIENTDDVVHVLSLKGLFQYLSPASKRVLEYEPSELVGTPLSSVCHPSDIVPVTRELKDTAPGATVNVVFRIRRKHSGYTWFESHGSLHTEQGKGKKCIILSGRERPVYALQRADIVSANEIGENEFWSKMSTSGMFLFVSANVRNVIDKWPEDLQGSSAQALMRRESKEEFNRTLEVARSGKIVTVKHDIQNRRGQTLHAQSTLYPGDASEGQKPTFLIAQTKLLKMSRSSQSKQGSTTGPDQSTNGNQTPTSNVSGRETLSRQHSAVLVPTATATSDALFTSAGGNGLSIGNQHEALASEDNVFDELKTTRSTSWQFELRQMEKRNRVLAEELQGLTTSKKKRKRRIGLGQLQKDCANCHTRNTPEWRRGPSGNRDLCNSCGLRWAKQNQSGKASPRTSTQQSEKFCTSPVHSSPLKSGTFGNSLNKDNSIGLDPSPTASSGGTNPTRERRSAEAQQSDSHNAKTSRMEAAAAQGFGGGIPMKIEESVEPDE